MRQARATLPGRSGLEGNRDDPGHLPGYPQTGRLFNPFPRAPIPGLLRLSVHRSGLIALT